MSGSDTPRDVRGFAWRLAPLQRKLQWELDAAKAALGDSLRRCEAMRAQQQAAQLRHAQAVADARSSAAAGRDPRSHRAMLGYLVVLGEQLAVAESNRDSAAQQVGAARQDVVRCQHRLDVLLHARKDALASHLQEIARQAQVESDAAWLALHAGGSRAGERA